MHYNNMYFLQWAAYQVYSAPYSVLVPYVIGMNIGTYMAYKHDKQAAINKGWRISEDWLLCLMFIGGTLGAIIAQKRLRHKTRKKSFRIKFYILLVMQLTIIVYITTAFR